MTVSSKQTNKPPNPHAIWQCMVKSNMQTFLGWKCRYNCINYRENTLKNTQTQKFWHLTRLIRRPFQGTEQQWNSLTHSLSSLIQQTYYTLSLSTFTHTWSVSSVCWWGFLHLIGTNLWLTEVNVLEHRLSLVPVKPCSYTGNRDLPSVPSAVCFVQVVCELNTPSLSQPQSCFFFHFFFLLLSVTMQRLSPWHWLP